MKYKYTRNTDGNKDVRCLDYPTSGHSNYYHTTCTLIYKAAMKYKNNYKYTRDTDENKGAHERVFTLPRDEKDMYLDRKHCMKRCAVQ